MHAPTPPPLVRLDRVTKTFGAHTAVDRVSLDLAGGEFLCLLGPSGCGKSTLLRLVAGFDAPTSGAIVLDGRDLAGLPPHRRPVNMMVQSYALFPHMSVAANVAYGLRGLGRAAVAARVAELLRLVRLEGFDARRPGTLSGGQRQRVALARALAREPRVLLLDEPLGALDRSLREETQGELRALQRRLGTSFVVVTHDPGEAMALADRIGVMDRGRLVQIGPPAELYEHPATRFVAGLLGDVNLVEGRLAADAPGAPPTVETALGPLAAGTVAEGAEPGGPVVAAIRPERIRLAAGASEPGANRLTGTLAEATYLGDRIRYGVRMADGTMLRATAGILDRPHPVTPGARVDLDVASAAVCVLPA